MTARLLDDPKLQVTTLRLLTMGRRITDVATAVHTPIADVESFARQHGWPDRSLMPALERLQAQLEDPSPAAPAETHEPDVEPVVPHELDAGDLIQRGLGSGQLETRDLAAHVDELLTELSSRLDAEDRERREAEEEVRRLEAELAAARERLADAMGSTGNGFTPKPSPAYVPAVVRAWARAEGIPCPAKGRIPHDVIDAWREANAA